jgi:hypothetical protein
MNQASQVVWESQGNNLVAIDGDGKVVRTIPGEERFAKSLAEVFNSDSDLGFLVAHGHACHRP